MIAIAGTAKQKLQSLLAGVNSQIKLDVSVSSDNTQYSILDGYLVDNDEMKLIQPIIEEEIMTIPDGIKIIGREAFTDDWRIEEIHLPNTVENIEWDAFGCRGLKKVVIPSSVTVIEGYMLGYYGDGATLEVEAGSYAEEYAHEAGYSYVYSTGAPDWLKD